MAGSREPVFTNDEKVRRTIAVTTTRRESTDNCQNYMLAEIIKSVSPSPTTMLNLVMQLGAHQPRWDDMPLPPGMFEFTWKISKKSHPHASPRRSISQRVSRCIRGFEAQLRIFPSFTDDCTANTAFCPHWTASTTMAIGNDNFLPYWPSWSTISSKTQERRAGRCDGHATGFSNSRRASKTQTRSSNQSRGPGESSRIKCSRSSRHISQERICSHPSCRHSWTICCAFTSSSTCISSSNHCIAKCRAPAETCVTTNFTRPDFSNDHYSDNSKDFKPLWIVFW